MTSSGVLPDTIRSTAKNAGTLDLRLVPERHNAVKVLLFLDIGGSMDGHVRVAEELFSACRTEFKHLEHFYFHNCIYEGVWKENRRRWTDRTATRDILLAELAGIMRRSAPSGRVRPWTLRARRGTEQPVPCRPRLILSDPEAIALAARQGLGVALVPMPFAFAHIASGELIRLLPGWYSDAGPLSLYYPSRRMLPAKTRVFVDFVAERFRSARFARLVDGS